MSDRNPERRSRWKPLGVVGAACVACCAGPLLAAVGGVGAAGSAAAFLAWPAAGLALAATTVAALVFLHRRRTPPRVDSEPVRVELTTRPRPDPAARRRP